MLFTQSLFLFYFLPLSLFILRVTTPRGTQTYPPLSRFLLITVTLFFYGVKQPLWLVPLLGSVFLDYLGARAIERNRGNSAAFTTLCFFLVTQIGILVFFKQWDYFKTFLPGQWQSVGHPPGISFFILESMSFLIDYYRGAIKEVPKISNILQFIAMFPRFIAGPIVRYSSIRSQAIHFTNMQVDAGLYVFIHGLFLKVCLADSFARFIGYADVTHYSASFLQVWVGVIAYAMQVYFDFSGYSLMAIGLGKCLGFQFPTNFDRPFHALTLHDYWNRWHMSLGAWLKDYLFHPMAVSLSRIHESFIYLALFLTMLLCGFWHGFSANFVLWGAWHGFFLCLERKFGWEKKLPLVIKRVVTLLIVFVGVGIYKSASVAEIQGVVWHLLNPSFGWELNIEAFSTYPGCSFFAFYGIFHCVVVEKYFPTVKMEKMTEVSLGKSLFGLCLFLLSLIWVLGDNYVPFLYFQF